jgi:hypothetical protein
MRAFGGAAASIRWSGLPKDVDLETGAWMKKTSVMCCTLLFGLWTMAFASAPASAMEETISARSFQAIQAAAPELVRRDLDITRYRIIVSDTQGLVVTFMDAEVTDAMRRHVRGNPGKIPALEVALDPKDFTVVRSSFMR